MRNFDEVQYSEQWQALFDKLVAEYGVADIRVNEGLNEFDAQVARQLAINEKAFQGATNEIS